jgi:anti-sigma factor ChrR (cupin superfamily)
MKLNKRLRSQCDTNQANFIPYNRYGAVVEGMSWLPLSGELLNNTYECFMLRMQPGTSTTAHEHIGHEEFLVLEGHLIDSDGAEYKAGDFIRFLPGSKHSSYSVDGCLLIVILRGSNRSLPADET